MKMFLILLAQFVVAFLLVYAFYYFTSLRKLKKKKKVGLKDLTIEARLFNNMYKVNTKKLSYYKLTRNISIISAFDIALILLATEVTDSVLLKVVIAFVLIIVVIYLSNKIYGFYLTKRGLIEDVQS